MRQGSSAERAYTLKPFLTSQGHNGGVFGVGSNNLTDVFRIRTFPANTKVRLGGKLVRSCLLSPSALALTRLQVVLTQAFCILQHILGFNEPNDPCAPCCNRVQARVLCATALDTRALDRSSLQAVRMQEAGQPYS